MQIKSIVAAMTILACLLLESTAIAASGEQNTAAKKPTTTGKVRNTRPAADHHKDARACLDAKKNETIIKCANKYH
jgi:hypothetical protein